MKKQVIAVIFCILVVCAARLVPHVANFSPMICVALFAGSLLDKRVAYVALALGLLLSDILLAGVWHYPVFGSWSLFTYSGLLAIVFAGSKIKNLNNKFTLGLVAALGSNLGFWLWTNLGVFAFSGMYGVNTAGLVACYTAAIPFLQHSMLSALGWYLILIAAYKCLALSRHNLTQHPNHQ